MAGQGIGSIIEDSKGKTFVYIPVHVSKDTRFPFIAKQKVIVRIKGRKLIVEKKKDTNLIES